jgi:uncharacterized membrane protein
MAMTGDAQQEIETYLRTVRSELRGLNAEDTREIIEELRSHIVERAALGGEITSKSVGAALAALGSPEELASQYVTDELLARAEVSRSPVHILDSLFRWASMSLAGFVVLLGSILGYFVGGALMWCAVLKFIHPELQGYGLITTPRAASCCRFEWALRAPLQERGMCLAGGSCP